MTPLNDQQRENIEKELFANRKISAIKIYREVTGSALADAARAVEQMDRDLRKSSPERFAAEKKGCLGVVMCLVMLAAIMTSVLTRLLH